MRAEEILAEVEALGVVVTADAEHLLLRPKSRVPERLVPELRANKTELMELVAFRGWPEASRDAVRRFRVTHARLYPFLGRAIETPLGTGKLLQVFPERAAVLLPTHPSVVFFLPSELRPVGAASIFQPGPEVH